MHHDEEEQIGEEEPKGGCRRVWEGRGLEAAVSGCKPCHVEGDPLMMMMKMITMN